MEDSNAFPAINKTIPAPSSQNSLLSSEFSLAFFASFCARTVFSRTTTLTSGSMEEQISHLPGVEAVNLTFATKQLRVWSDDAKTLLPQIQDICTSILPAQ